MDENNKSDRTLEMVLSNFTDDLWTEIFLRLPLKPLLRFKSVSKSWFSIISSHRFAKSHLANAAKDDQILIVHHELGDYEMEDENTFYLFHLGSDRILKNLKFPYSQGEYPLEFETPFSSLIGSDCGIVCVYVSVSPWRAAKKDVDIYLWNPATKQSKIIPPHTLLDYRSIMALGFGFDHVDLDFKVVRIVCRESKGPVCLAEVYSSNRNTWRNIEPKPIDVPDGKDFHVCLHGFLLTIGSNRGMMAFDINKEVFICDVNLPYSSSEEDQEDGRIVEFKDTIAVIISLMFESVINLWTLDDEACLCGGGGGVKASWTINQIIDVGVRVILVEGLFNDVQFLLIDEDDDRFLYNSSKKVITNDCIPSYFALKEFFKYRESLFSLVGFKRIKWAAQPSRSRESSDWDVEIDYENILIDNNMIMGRGDDLVYGDHV